MGYLKELKGSKKTLLLPGEHEIAVRQAGYKDFLQRVAVRPGEKQVIKVAMEKGSPHATSDGDCGNQNPRLRRIEPAVFVDGLFAGHGQNLVELAEPYWLLRESGRSRSV